MQKSAFCGSSCGCFLFGRFVYSGLSSLHCRLDRLNCSRRLQRSLDLSLLPHLRFRLKMLLPVLLLLLPQLLPQRNPRLRRLLVLLLMLRLRRLLLRLLLLRLNLLKITLLVHVHATSTCSSTGSQRRRSWYRGTPAQVALVASNLNWDLDDLSLRLRKLVVAATA